MDYLLRLIFKCFYSSSGFIRSNDSLCNDLDSVDLAFTKYPAYLSLYKQVGSTIVA